jgi:hypothetical protein
MMSKKNLLVLFGLVATSLMFSAEKPEDQGQEQFRERQGSYPPSRFGGETSGIGVFSLGEVVHNAGVWRIFYGETDEERYLSGLPKRGHLQQGRGCVEAPTAGRILPAAIVA